MYESEQYSDIVNQAVPYMLLLTALEFVFGVIKKKKYHRLNDSLGRYIKFYNVKTLMQSRNIYDICTHNLKVSPNINKYIILVLYCIVPALCRLEFTTCILVSVLYFLFFIF